MSHHERKKSQLEQINEMPLYPTEDIIWDENIVPTEYYSGEGGKLLHTTYTNTYGLPVFVILFCSVCLQKLKS